MCAFSASPMARSRRKTSFPGPEKLVPYSSTIAIRSVKLCPVRSGNSCSRWIGTSSRYSYLSLQQPFILTDNCTAVDLTGNSCYELVFTVRCTLVQSAVLRSHVVCLSVCPSVRPSVTLVNCDHVGWNSSKIISWSVSLGCSLFATQTSRVYSKGNTLEFSPE